jgi:hypothetical protein
LLPRDGVDASSPRILERVTSVMVFECKTCGERQSGLLESPKPRVCRTCYDRAPLAATTVKTTAEETTEQQPRERLLQTSRL